MKSLHQVLDFWGERGPGFYCCERVVQKQEFQTHSNVKKTKFAKLDGFSHHFVLNSTFFTSSSFPFSWFFIMKKAVIVQTDPLYLKHMPDVLEGHFVA